MEHAIITAKHADGSVKTIRSSVIPPPPELEQKAKELDAYLSKAVKAAESALVKAGLVERVIPASGAKKPTGNVRSWHGLGTGLREICRKAKISSPRERRWLWEAVENIHATDRIRRAGRGRTRLHFEYCYRLAGFPLDVAEKLNWSEWVYYFDSLTVREERRIDDWLRDTAEHEKTISRLQFRRFTENLNKRIRQMDTSVLSDKELFAIYHGVWKETKKALVR